MHGIRATGFLIAATSSLVFTSACKKAASDVASSKDQTSLAGKPRSLLLLFGDRNDPRVLPIATLVDSQIKPIVLNAVGWHHFDSLYFAAGAKLALYQRGNLIGDAVVRRGMWDGKDALYRLPACRALRPLAAVTIAGPVTSAVELELLATSDPLPTPPARPTATAADMDSARALTTRVGQHEGLTAAARSELDQVVFALPTGATTHPTLVGSYIERGSGLNGKPRHVFVIGDYIESAHGYLPTFVHVPGDSIREFRRLIDHANLTAGAVDEIVLEGWHKDGDSYLIFMQYRDGKWREVARGANNWCADEKV